MVQRGFTLQACNEGQYHWNITFTRGLHDWEEESIFGLLTLLVDMDLDAPSEGNEKIIQSLDPNGTLSVES